MRSQAGELICDVCHAEPAVGVASSPLGAFSQAYGRRCLEEQAEPLGMVHTTIWCVGGPERVADWVKLSIRSFHEGRYISWDEIVLLYDPTRFADPPEPPEGRVAMEQQVGIQRLRDWGWRFWWVVRFLWADALNRPDQMRELLAEAILQQHRIGKFQPKGEKE